METGTWETVNVKGIFRIIWRLKVRKTVKDHKGWEIVESNDRLRSEEPRHTEKELHHIKMKSDENVFLP